MDSLSLDFSKRPKRRSFRGLSGADAKEA